MTDIILEVENLVKYFPVYGGVFRKKIADIKAVDGISFKVKKGQTFGLVGESGSGKTNISRSQDCFRSKNANISDACRTSSNSY